MARSKFNADTRQALIVAFDSGCSLPDAAAACDVRESTLKAWLTRGRKDDAPEAYAQFVRDVDRARADAEERLAEPMDRGEFKRLISKLAKRGNTTAARLYWDILETERRIENGEEEGPPADADPDDPLAQMDELAARRAARE